ncbi:putative RNA polymerase II-associated protein 1 [Paratrimastix pyriformis]|uniref:RNA polymerase II-associated protein 1 n=1 Tax=Paratrimastix pyriformis TaxID=342808 RepID=A0ABQ8UR95_9EUKA|nr:putative RNA polymerase II-associated protein 1 [Paratrimastix pyriformis]
MKNDGVHMEVEDEEDEDEMRDVVTLDGGFPTRPPKMQPTGEDTQRERRAQQEKDDPVALLEEADRHLTAILSGVTEHDDDLEVAVPIRTTPHGFPSAFRRDDPANPLRFRRGGPATSAAAGAPVPVPKDPTLNMSEEEIKQAQKEIESFFSPSAVAFLRERGKKKAAEAASGGAPAEPAAATAPAQEPKPLAPSGKPSALGKPPGTERGLQGQARQQTAGCWSPDKWEAEKVAWMQPGAKPSTRPDESLPQWRFGFDGEIIAATADLPTSLGLHHHGDDPDQAGYTIAELLHLSMSQAPGQRTLAINMIGAILVKARETPDRHGLLYRLLEQFDVAILLRVALDAPQATVIVAGCQALAALICPPQDEALFNCLEEHHWPASTEPSPMPILDPRNPHPPPKAPHPGEDEDEDTVAARIQEDLVEGLLQTDLLVRLRYLLEVERIPAAAPPIIRILLRIARHSLQAATSLVECPRLLGVLVHSFVAVSCPPSPKDLPYGACVPEVLAILRTLSLWSPRLSRLVALAAPIEPPQALPDSSALPALVRRDDHTATILLRFLLCPGALPVALALGPDDSPPDVAAERRRCQMVREAYGLAVVWARQGLLNVHVGDVVAELFGWVTDAASSMIDRLHALPSRATRADGPGEEPFALTCALVEGYMGVLEALTAGWMGAELLRDDNEGKSAAERARPSEEQEGDNQPPSVLAVAHLSSLVDVVTTALAQFAALWASSTSPAAVPAARESCGWVCVRLWHFVGAFFGRVATMAQADPLPRMQHAEQVAQLALAPWLCLLYSGSLVAASSAIQPFFPATHASRSLMNPPPAETQVPPVVRPTGLVDLGFTLAGQSYGPERAPGRLADPAGRAAFLALRAQWGLAGAVVWAFGSMAQANPTLWRSMEGCRAERGPEHPLVALADRLSALLGAHLPALAYHPLHSLPAPPANPISSAPAFETVWNPTHLAPAHRAACLGSLWRAGVDLLATGLRLTQAGLVPAGSPDLTRLHELALYLAAFAPPTQERLVAEWLAPQAIWSPLLFGPRLADPALAAPQQQAVKGDAVSELVAQQQASVSSLDSNLMLLRAGGPSFSLRPSASSPLPVPPQWLFDPVLYPRQAPAPQRDSELMGMLAMQEALARSGSQYLGQLSRGELLYRTVHSFLCTESLFLSGPGADLLQGLLSRYSAKPTPAIWIHPDLSTQLLRQYNAVSYGSALFGQVMTLYMRAHPFAIRIEFWTEMPPTMLRSLTAPPLGDIQGYLRPLPRSTALATAIINAIIHCTSPKFSPAINGSLYWMVVSYLAFALFDDYPPDWGIPLPPNPAEGPVPPMPICPQLRQQLFDRLAACLPVGRHSPPDPAEEGMALRYDLTWAELPRHLLSPGMRGLLGLGDRSEQPGQGVEEALCQRRLAFLEGCPDAKAAFERMRP